MSREVLKWQAKIVKIGQKITGLTFETLVVPQGSVIGYVAF